MSYAEIVAELPRLTAEERQRILVQICEIEEGDLTVDNSPGDAEKHLLDREWEDYEREKDSGTPADEVIAQLRTRSGR